MKKIKVFIIDTSALLSGKPLHMQEGMMMTTPGVSAELRPGGRDFRAFEFLIEKGLLVESPSKKSLQLVKKTAEQTGDALRLSSADTELLALAVDLRDDVTKDPVLITDDYSIQNVATTLGLQYQNISEKKITQKFKWACRCPGCGKQLKEPRTICPICGTETRLVSRKKKDIGNRSDDI
jgi:UPF0271 protein